MFGVFTPLVRRPANNTSSLEALLGDLC